MDSRSFFCFVATLQIVSWKAEDIAPLAWSLRHFPVPFLGTSRHGITRRRD